MKVVEMKQAVADNAKKINEMFMSPEAVIAPIEHSYTTNALKALNDNLYLDRYGYLMWLEHENVVDAAGKVYEAAKAVFAENPATNIMIFDIDSDLSMPSPWTKICDSPELYTLAYAHRDLEDDEGCINNPDWVTVLNVLRFMERMRMIGISEEILKANVDFICYYNEELTDVAQRAINL